MLKQMIILVIVSLLITLTFVYDQQAIQYLIWGHDYVSLMLRDVFSGGHVGSTSRELLAMLVIPVVAGVGFAGIYYLVQKRWFPYFMEVVWVIWLVQVSALIVTYAG